MILEGSVGYKTRKSWKKGMTEQRCSLRVQEAKQGNSAREEGAMGQICPPRSHLHDPHDAPRNYTLLILLRDSQARKRNSTPREADVRHRRRVPVRLGPYN